jgi:anti-anti-sigma factor
MEIANYSKDHILILTVKGRLDAVSAPHLQESLMGFTDEGKYFFVLDFHDLEYISSAGIRVLYQALSVLEGKEGKMLIAGPRDTVKKVFDMVELSADIPIHTDIESAVEAF